MPEPALRDEVFDPYEVLVPYSKYHDVERPFGFTEPPRVADGRADVGRLAGGHGGCALRRERPGLHPLTVPASLVATRRKW